MDAPNLGTALARHLSDNPSGGSFPESTVDYFDRFKRLDEWLNANIHKHVNQGATAKRDEDVDPDEPNLWLTDHGPEHIHTVIQRASRLVCEDKCVLTPYETYLLLLSIHFHDVGNIYGREKHEQRITTVMGQIETNLLGVNTLEKRMVRDIAMVHGGKINGDKDTIRYLPYERQFKKNEPRVHLLAALLRISDELAEDHTRTSRFLIENKLIEGSEMYHMYADRLRRVQLFPHEHRVSLQFEIDTGVGTRTFSKDGTQGFLYDEIQLRLLKMHKELVYCNRYMRPYVNLDTIEVKVEICSPGYLDILDTISMNIRESGYPSAPEVLADVCPEAKESGLSLQKRIEGLMGKSNGN